MPKIKQPEQTQPHERLRFVNSMVRVLNELPGRRRVQFWLLLTAMVCQAALEAAVLGIVALFASSVADPVAVLNSSTLATVKWAVPSWALTEPKGLVLFLSGLVVVLLLAKNLFSAWVVYWSRRFAAIVDGFFGRKILEGFLSLPYVWHLYQNSADLILMIQWRINFGTNLVFNSLKFLSDFLIVSFMLLALLVIQPVISLAVLVVLGGFSLCIFTSMRRFLDKAAMQIKDLNASINRHAARALQGIKDVKIYGQEQNFLRDYVEEVYTLAHLEAKRNVLNLSPRWILEGAGFIALTLAICLMLFFMEASPATVTGTIALLAVTAWKSLPAVVRILANVTQVRNSLPFVDKGFQYLDEVKKRVVQKQLPADRCGEFSFERSIELRNASFRYETGRSAVLKDLNITIDKGSTVGVIGPSGAGKSTLVDVLVGLLQPSRGQLLIDGQPLDGDTLACWIRCLGYVPQDPFIYDGTLAENIAFGLSDDEIDRQKVLDCCRMAAVSEFMEQLPEGMDTNIGERGMRLSGGQQQRVSIARALYNEPQVMIFDEATSSLDTKSEMEIQKTIYSFKGKLTLVIIAHRLSTVEKCDCLIWVDKGEVRMVGAPDEVLAAYDLAQDHASEKQNEC